MPITWNEKSERDLMAAMLMSMAGAAAGRLGLAWPAVAANMGHMGYDTNASAISQRWSKHVLRSLKTEHPGIFSDGASSTQAESAATTTTETAPVAGKKRGRGRPPKVRKSDNNDNDNGGGDVDVAADAANDGDIDSEPHKPAKMPKIENEDEDGVV